MNPILPPNAPDSISPDVVASAQLPPDQAVVTIGQRLAAARQAKGWTLEYCAESLHLPRSLLRKLEADEHLGIDYAIYLRSYISNYARLLGVPAEAINDSLPQIGTSQPQLVSTGGISRSRHLLERYARAATYVMFTAVIVVPVAWLGVSGALDHNISHLHPLDAAPVASAAVASSTLPDASSQLADGSASKPQPLNAPSVVAAVPGMAPAASAPAQPLMASMMPGLDDHAAVSPSASGAAASGVDPDVVGSGSHSLGLGLSQASWVEVTTADGKRLEYGLLPADSSKTFRSDQDLVVRIGNASSATVTLDGAPVALDAYRRANVARFRVAVQGTAASASGF